MSVVPLTLTISLCLVFTFVIFFLHEHARGRVSSTERDSLLPLAEEEPRLVPVLVRPDLASRGHRGGRGGVNEGRREGEKEGMREGGTER